jgi:prophage regulatory protein
MSTYFRCKTPISERHLKMNKENLLSVISTPELVHKVQLRHEAKLLRIKQVLELYPVGRSTLYKMIAENRFPKQVSLSAKSVAWREVDVVSFINSLQGAK